MKIKEYFDRIATKRDIWKKKNMYYYEYIENKLLPFLIPSGKRVLEIGCGTGDLLAKLKPARGLGIDISEGMIKLASKKYSNLALEFKVAEPNNINEKFDFVVMSDLVGYLDDVQGLFARLHDVTHTRSRIVITQYNQLWEPILEFGSKLKIRMPSMHQNWLSENDIENLLYLAGCEIIKRGRKMILPKKIPLISRFLNGFLANLWPFNQLALINYIVARPFPSWADNPMQLSPKTEKSLPSVSIVVAARNEAGMIRKIIDELPNLGGGTELIFVEGGSSDNTLDVIKKEAASYTGSKIIKFAVQDGKGKGDAVRKGFDMATGDILMIYDADMTVPPQELNKFYDAIASGRGEFINGSRLVYPMEKESMRFLNYLGNKFFSSMFSWLLGQRIKDTLCGTKVLWRTDYEDIKSGRYFFGNFDPFGDFDLLFGAAKLNYKIIDLPVHYRERTYGATNISRWSHGWLLLKMVVFAMKKIKFI